MLSHLNMSDEYEILSSQDIGFIQRLVEKMAHDQRVDLLKCFPTKKRDEILQQVAKTEGEDILNLISYKEGTTGAIMTTDYAVIEEEMTVEQALEKLRVVAPDSETIYYAYIINGGRKLRGAVSLRQLITAEKGKKVSELVSPDTIKVKVSDADHVTAQMLKEADLIAVPVTDDEGRMVGIVTFDDAMQVIEDDTSSLMYQKAGIAAQSDRDKERERDLLNSSQLLSGSIRYPIRLRILAGGSERGA